MALSEIALCTRALIGLGCTGISGFDEATAEAEVSVNLYPVTRDALLSAHPWSFAVDQTSLARLVTAPAADYAYSYGLPTDFLRALSAGTGDRGRGLSYRLKNGRMETDAEAVLLTYVYRPEPEAFPPFFDMALIAKLRAEFCLPLTESTTRAQTMHQLAEAEFRRAKLIDGQQATPQAIEDFPLIDARG